MTEARILVVEDEAVLALDMRSRLSNLGCPLLDVVHSGEDAVRKDAQRMAALIDGILQLSRVTCSEIRRGRVDFSALVSTAPQIRRPVNG